MAYTEIQKTTATNNFGTSVAINGYYALVSNLSANVSLYRRDYNGDWVFLATITESGATASAKVVAMHGDYFLIGDPTWNSSTGRVFLYPIDDPTNSITSWSGSGINEEFGSAIAMSDSYIAIGAQRKNSYKGAAYVYEKGTGETWTASASNPITPLIATSNDYFGNAIAIQGAMILVGAKRNNDSKGAVYVFSRNSETNLWIEGSKLLASDGSAGDQFGGAISASNNYLAIGAQFWDSDDGDGAGAVYLFKYTTSWYEIDKLTGTGESSYISNHFGATVDLEGDYLAVGSPDARGSAGVADLYYKKRSWGHLKKLVPADATAGDNFGNSVGVWGPYVVIGAYEHTSSNGAIYLFEDPPINLRLAQEFDVNGEFLPSKTSLFLKRAGENETDTWMISNIADNVIDATNFLTITESQDRVIFSDTIGGFTGNGYMYQERYDYSSSDVINYPLMAMSADTFTLWIRCLNENGGTFAAEILIDGVVAKTLNETLDNPSTTEWDWISTTLVLPDVNEHTLGIRMKDSGQAIDKLYITAGESVPYADGPAYSTSPYVTIHLQMYDSDGSPTTPLFIYDYKNTVEEVTEDDWYNFDLKVLDDFHGHSQASDFTGSYYLVMSTSGSHTGNFVVWDMIDNDEYTAMPSAFRI